MPLRFSSGVDEVSDPTDIGPGGLAEGTGVEYRVGSPSIWAVRGRARHGGISGTNRGLYCASFDDGNSYLIGSNGTNYEWALVDVTMSFAPFSTSVGPGGIVGTHFGNRHYITTGDRFVVVNSNMVAAAPGMVGCTAAISASTLSTAGNWSATIGCEYWVTEYDSVRGIESIMAGSTGNSGPVASVSGVDLLLTGVSSNSNADYWIIYRTADGDVFPAGGRLAQIPIGTTFYTDTDISTGEALLPAYGNIDVGGLDFHRDVQPETMVAVATFDGSLVGIPASNRHAIQFTPANFPESWPEIYEIPLQTKRHDVGQGFVELNGMLGVFCRDTIHRLVRLPREIDAAFAPSEVLSLVTDERGAVSRTAITTFTMPGRGPLAAFATRDGIWATNLAPNITIPLTDSVAWKDRVDVEALESSCLVNDVDNRRLVFMYQGVGQTYAHSVMYLDYQQDNVRITHPNHGPLAAGCLVPYEGVLRLFTADSRSLDGSVYSEGTADADASDLVDSNGTILGAIRTPELFPAGVQDTAKISTATWMHGAGGPAAVDHEMFQDRIAIPLRAQPKLDFSSREATDVSLERTVNSFSLRLSWAATAPFEVAWVDAEGLESSPLHGDGA